MKIIKITILQFLLVALIISSCKKDDTKKDLLIETVVGTTTPGFEDGPIATAKFNRPNGITIDQAGNLYVTDRENHKVRKISASGMVTTLAGSGTFGFKDGHPDSAQFNSPGGIAVDAQGNVYVTDWFNHRVRLITPTSVSTYAGSGFGFVDGERSVARFNFAKGILLDASGNFYIADQNNHSIRKISSAGIVSTIAGDGTKGSTDGPAQSARFSDPRDVAIDAGGNIYVADAGNHSIRKISAAGVVSTLAGGSQGFADGNGTSAKFDEPKGVAVDKNNNIIVVDQRNHSIRKITPDGTVTTIAGDGISGDANSSPVRFNNPRAITIDKTGTFAYIADQGNNLIRKITLY
ncbi:MAG: NHL repeat-containing protein [Chitinophagaceae bacterium]